MTDQNAEGARAGYRKVGVLLLVGLGSIGFTRLEDRAIIGPPGGSGNPVAALAVASSADPEENYAQAPDDSVALGNVSRVPSNRIRRVLSDRDIPNVASRQILAPSVPQVEGPTGGGSAPIAERTLTQALTPIQASPPAFASLAPPLGGQGAPVFAANLPANGPPSGGPGGGGPGTGGGDNGGVIPPPPPPPPPVTPIPEPGSWLMLMLGLFAVGGVLRHGKVPAARRVAVKFS